MHAPIDIPPSKNDICGFFGTMGDHADSAWIIAMIGIAKATNVDLPVVQTFLDSCHGRRFAHDVRSQMYIGRSIKASVDAVIDDWMMKKIGPLTSRDYGIQRGLPYLAGLVHHCDTMKKMWISLGLGLKKRVTTDVETNNPKEKK